MGTKSASAACVFQFTPLREGRLEFYNNNSKSIDVFQFTPLREGRLRRTHNAGSPRLFQFTPLREGRRGGCGSKKPDERISIHAPPRGATRKNARVLSSTTFQFTPLREGRRVWFLQSPDSQFYFNSRPSARGDKNTSKIFLCIILFQFTPLREGRRGWNYPSLCFCPISIHAPPRGATELIYFIREHYPISIHAPPRGATVTINFAKPRRYFNSRPSARGDNGCGSI